MDEIKSKQRPKRRKLTFSQYYNASQLRADTWNRLSTTLCSWRKPKRATVTWRGCATVSARRSSCSSRSRATGCSPGATPLPGCAVCSRPRTTATWLCSPAGSCGRYRTMPIVATRFPCVPPPKVPRPRARSRRPSSTGRSRRMDGRISRCWWSMRWGRSRRRRSSSGMRQARRPDDPFLYELLVVPSAEAALIAILTNYNIQTVVIRFSFPYRTRQPGSSAAAGADGHRRGGVRCGGARRSRHRAVRGDRSAAARAVRLHRHRRVDRGDGRADSAQLPARVLPAGGLSSSCTSISCAASTPATRRRSSPRCKDYSRQPTGVFHAMPISRGKSIIKSHWIQDMGEFYGMNIFLAETSATSGGLDSLLEPTGPIKKAQDLAARAFGAQRTYFVTNGTSTANKIVVQALVAARRHRPDRPQLPQVAPLRPGAGRRARHLSGRYPLQPVLDVRCRAVARDQAAAAGVHGRAGKLDRVRMLLLTNCTFDGIVYNVGG